MYMIMDSSSEEQGSPLSEQRKLKKLEIKEQELKFEHENMYSCCFGNHTDKRVLEYVFKMCLSLTVLLFCFYQLIEIEECSEMQSFYTGLISLIIGTFIKTPEIKSKS